MRELTSEEQGVVVDHLWMADMAVRKLARKFRPRLTTDDVRSAAHMGLVKAVAKYNRELSAFRTYAWWWIVTEIRREHRRCAMVREPFRDARCRTAPRTVVRQMPNWWEPAAAIDDTGDVGAVLEMTPRLTTRERTLVEMVLLGGATPSEAGQAMGVGRHTLTKTKRSAIEKLREMIRCAED